MDSNNSMIVAAVGLAISMFGSVLAVVNHRRIRSHCCGVDLVASVDVENTTPSVSESVKTVGDRPAAPVLASVSVNP